MTILYKLVGIRYILLTPQHKVLPTTRSVAFSSLTGIAQYKAELSRNDGSGRRRKRQTTNLIPDNIIEQVIYMVYLYTKIHL